MKTILNTFVALGVLASVASVSTSAHAFDARTFWEDQAKIAR